jgi:hypothetical protein
MLLASSPIIRFQVSPSVVCLSECIENCQFWFFKYFRIRELPVPVLWKKFRIRHVGYHQCCPGISFTQIYPLGMGQVYYLSYF